jgi:hypothetical protein
MLKGSQTEGNSGCGPFVFSGGVVKKPRDKTLVAVDKILFIIATILERHNQRVVDKDRR